MEKIVLFLINLKVFLFWLWLWQLKEYHSGRFLAHFETQAIRKFIASFYWFKQPKYTKKIIVIFISSVLFLLFLVFFLDLVFLIILFLTMPVFVSLIVFFFQIPTVILRKIIIKKATEKRKKFKDLTVIGITGSYGKTSTKEVLAEILIKEFGQEKVLKTKEHQNSEMAISQTVLKELNSNHQFFVVEMGAYSKKGIKLLADIVQPRIAVLTGINEQHMSTFGSQEDIIKTKYELVEALPENGVAFFNARNRYCYQLYQKTLNVEKFLYGQESESFNQENVLGAIAVVEKLGVKIKEKPLFREMEIKKGINGLKIVDSTYSANPDGLISHLDYLDKIKQDQNKLIVIMPCLIELGSASKQVHQRIGQKINQVCDLAVITTKDRFKEIKEKAGEKAFLIEKPEKIIKKIKEFSQLGDIILLESRLPSQLIKQLIINNQ
jgi:UDP-N-acetylmuramoyl-tripeptide--D-alanyl-D-alanine ligase